MKSLWTKLPTWSQRRAARWLGRRTCRMQAASPLISFTFDDFPRSALLQGGAILREHGFAGTYYASFGLMGRTAPTGEIFSAPDLKEFVRQGHEMGCHTFDHYDSWATSPAEFEASILRNQKELAELLPGASFTSLSYPISWPRPQTKRRMAKYFDCARGGGQSFNTGTVDLNYLQAFFIEQCKGDFNQIQQIIEANTRARGWLIFATHDVCGSPTRFGCTPEFFRRVVECAVESGAAILPVREALLRALPTLAHEPAVAQTFLSAGSAPIAIGAVSKAGNTGLESPVNPQVGKPALHSRRLLRFEVPMRGPQAVEAAHESERVLSCLQP
jgi:peptidoglycan/xylan/chitin deacetylase (PgdA/CDA1 family)